MDAPHAVGATDDDHLVERRLEGRQVFAGRLLDVRCDTVALPDGSTATREYVVHPGAVMVVPLLDDGRLLMERQFRYAVGRVMLEFPAGKLDAGEPVLACARRELIEETGYRAQEWAYAGVIHNACAYSNEGIHICFARGLVPGPRALDAGELLDTLILDEATLDQLAFKGEVTDIKTLIGLQWLQRWRAGAWALSWQPAPAASGGGQG
ncbi:MAG: NUDIX domain-containing protein [Aquabacterium sp.]